MDLPVQQQDTYSDYIVYVDESGDHGLARIDPQYPVFVLAFCIIRIEEYRLRVVPGLQAFKFQHFGHDMVVLHERDTTAHGCRSASGSAIKEATAAASSWLIWSRGRSAGG